jgi:transposase
LVALASLAGNPDTRQRLWETAARANHIARDDVNENRCLISAAECIVEKANLAQASPMTKASFLQDAIDRFRPVPGTRERRTELHDELRRVQPGIWDETRQSGQWRGKAFIRGGRAALRQAVYIPALVATRFNPDFKEKYRALREAGKPPKVAITAIMRKLIILANALIRDGRKWTPRAT